MNTQTTDTKIDPATSLFNTVYTKQDLMIFYKELDQIMTHMFMGDGNFEETVSSILSPEKKEAVLSFLNEEKINMKNPVDIKVALSKIRKMGDTLPVVALTLAFEPTEAIIKNISSWFLKRFAQKVILDFSLERSAIGGAYVSYGGLYKDYTLQTKLDHYFEKGDADLRRKEEPQNNAESSSA